jgi:Na+/H+-dicarboxylate symporter
MSLIILSIIVGAGLGALIHNYDVDPAVSKWIKLPGDLYVRAIQCVVVPLVFVNLTVSVADIVHVGQGMRIGVRVAALFTLMTAICIAEGIGIGYISRSVLNVTNTSKPKPKLAVFGIQCSNGKYLEELADGLVTCSAASINATSQFIVNDVNNAFVRNDASASTTSSLTDNLIVVLKMIVPSNIMAAFVNNTLLSIVAFAIPAGVTLARSFHGPIQLNPLLEFLREVNESLIMMVNWVMRFTPIAVLSLLAGAFGASLSSIMNKSPVMLTLNVTGLYLAAVVVHMFVVVPLIFSATARSNPFSFMKHLLPSYVYSLGCSSSMAALPVTMACIEQSRAVSNSVMYFVMSIGASVHMNGTAIYLPMMVMFLVDVSGLDAQLGTTEMCILAIASFLGSLAAAPVPSGSYVMLATVWSITFPRTSLPQYSAFLLAADVLLDRFVTMCNVNGDAMVCRIIEEQANEMLPNVMRA